VIDHRVPAQYRHRASAGAAHARERVLECRSASSRYGHAHTACPSSGAPASPPTHMYGMLRKKIHVSARHRKAWMVVWIFSQPTTT
jgi:hypothetical protein